MLFDKILLDNLKQISDIFCKEYKIEKPKDYATLVAYFRSMANAIDEQNVYANYIAMVLYHFVSNEEVRDRGTTARIMEDIFASMLGIEVADKNARTNPEPTELIKSYDVWSTNESFSISQDLSNNRREKTDYKIGEYDIQIKTLKGYLYDKDLNIVDKSINTEINAGSFSYRSLFCGLLDKPLGERKAGLGSRKQIIQTIKEIEKNGKMAEFKRRIKDFVDYIYQEDTIVVYKSGYKFIVYLIPNETFKQSIILPLNSKESIKAWSSIWNRWEGNNLRINFMNMLKQIDEYKLPYAEIDLNLSVFDKIKALKDMIEYSTKSINLSIFQLSVSVS